MDMPGVSAEKFQAVVDRVPATVPEVIAQQAELQSLLEAAAPAAPVTGLAYFNYLYKVITETVLSALGDGSFVQPEFLSVLDVEFAKRYFSALSAWGNRPLAAPRAWGVLLERGYRPDISAMQFAVAGVNAHINFDLAFSVVNTFTALGIDFDEGCRADYQYVNQIFHVRIPTLKDYLENTFWARLDDLGGQWDDWLEDRTVVMTRDRAWKLARRIWAVRHLPEEVARASHRLDRSISLIGRGLLVHV
jgi:hypothetical protein